MKESAPNKRKWKSLWKFSLSLMDSKNQTVPIYSLCVEYLSLSDKYVSLRISLLIFSFFFSHTLVSASLSKSLSPLSQSLSFLSSLSSACNLSKWPLSKFKHLCSFEISEPTKGNRSAPESNSGHFTETGLNRSKWTKFARPWPNWTKWTTLDRLDWNEPNWTQMNWMHNFFKQKMTIIYKLLF